MFKSSFQIWVSLGEHISISGAIRESDLEESLDSAVLLLLQKPLQFFLFMFLGMSGGFKDVVLRSCLDDLLCIPFHHLTGH